MRAGGPKRLCDLKRLSWYTQRGLTVNPIKTSDCWSPHKRTGDKRRRWTVHTASAPLKPEIRSRDYLTIVTLSVTCSP